MTLANAHALFHGQQVGGNYLTKLTIADEERAKLMAARKAIRAALREAASTLAEQEDVWKENDKVSMARGNRPKVVVKFMTQGSFAYKTINAPAQRTHQEIDLDDGMYVPVTFLEGQRPPFAAKALFSFVERVLETLCLRNSGWHLDKSKEHCARIKLWKGAHIDVPIYSIPQDRFQQLVESMERLNILTATFGSSSFSKGLDPLPSDKIMLAHRSGKWEQSDPQQLNDWVENRVKRYGEVYRRLCRFFKGWRDYTWSDCKLSSICLMASVDEALNQLGGQPASDRDDALILEVAKLLPAILNGNVKNPVLPNLSLNAHWSADQKTNYVEAATMLQNGMSGALENMSDAESIVGALQRQFGNRIPDRPDLVLITSQLEMIRKSAPALTPAPRVIGSTSG